MNDYKTLIYEEKNSVAWITINRPEAHNSFTAEMQEEFRSLWQSLRSNDEVNAIILTGSGEKAFCVGIDRDEPFTAIDQEKGLYGTSNNFMYDDPGDWLGPKSNDLWKPVIGAVNGMACGGAFYLLSQCDILIASENATFFDPHVSYGMPAIYEPMSMLNKMPFGEVMRMALTGNSERITAETALRIGLVTEVVPHIDLLHTAEQLAISIAESSPWAVQGTLRAIWAALDLGRLGGKSIATSLLSTSTDPDAIKEGSNSFISGKRTEPRSR